MIRVDLEGTRRTLPPMRSKRPLAPTFVYGVRPVPLCPRRKRPFLEAQTVIGASRMLRLFAKDAGQSPAENP
jgi:hypothetical protein